MKVKKKFLSYIFLALLAISGFVCVSAEDLNNYETKAGLTIIIEDEPAPTPRSLIEVTHETKDGRILATAEKFENPVGHEIEVSAKEFDNYRLVRDQSPKVKLKHEEKDTKYTFLYEEKKDTSKISVKYETSDGRILSKDEYSGKIGETKSIVAKKFDNYLLIAGQKENATLTFGEADQEYIFYYKEKEQALPTTSSTKPLPTTGEKILKSASIFGGILVGLAFILFIWKRRKQENADEKE